MEYSCGSAAFADRLGVLHTVVRPFLLKFGRHVQEE